MSTPRFSGARRMTTLLLCCVAPGLHACAHVRGDAAAQPHSITTAAERGSSAGPAAWFSGDASVAPLFGPNGPRDFGAAYVTFQPGARTAWHSHPAGQTLVVTDGTGWVQVEGEPRRDIKPGDVVWTPPGVRHWHGATRSTAMTHIALQGEVEGRVVDWFEPVADATYLAEGTSEP